MTFTAFTFFFLVCAVAGIHRLYNYESVFSSIRQLVGQRWWLKPLWCAKCNIFWITVILTSVAYVASNPWNMLLLLPFAIYPWVRGMVWIYDNLDRFSPATTVIAPTKAPITPNRPATASAGCTSCKSAEDLKKENDTNLSYEKRFVLMTMFGDFKPSYSLTTVVIDQARMLAVNPKWLVQVWVLNTCNLDDVPKDLPSNVEIKKVLPPIPLPEDKVDEKARDIFFGQALRFLMVLGNATVITHDLLFVNSFTTVAAAIHQKLGMINGFRWFHFCHSAPAQQRPSDPLALSLRASLPEGHTLMCLAPSQVDAFAAYYGVTRDRVVVAPNARDIRGMLSMSPRAVTLAAKHQLLSADVVQLFPLSTPRAGAKGLSRVIAVFAEMEKRGKTVRLIVANAHANNNQAMVATFRSEAHRVGLSPEALVFTSEACPDLAYPGLSSADVAALFQLSNVFIFPTISEACSMTLMEAAVSGCLLVLNQDVSALADIVPLEHALHFSWGRVGSDGYPPNPSTVADQVLNALDTSPANRSKRSVLRTHSWEAIGERLRRAVS